jgi:hypothetical protein
VDTFRSHYGHSERVPHPHLYLIVIGISRLHSGRGLSAFTVKVELGVTL